MWPHKSKVNQKVFVKKGSILWCTLLIVSIILEGKQCTVYATYTTKRLGGCNIPELINAILNFLIGGQNRSCSV